MKEYDEENLELYDEEDEVLGVDEEIKRNHNEEESEFPGLDDEEDSVEETDEEDSAEEKPEKSVKVTETALLKALRQELAKVEYRRNYFRFRYRGEKYSGIPLHELNPGKYVFLIDDKMKGIYLNEMEIF